MMRMMRSRNLILLLAMAFALIVRAAELPGSAGNVQSAVAADAFVDSIGVNIHLSYFDTVYGKYDQIIKPRLLELGLRHIRDGGPSPQQKVVIERLNDLAGSGIRSILIYDWRKTPEKGVLDSLKTVLKSVELVEGPNETDNAGINYKGQKFPEALRLYQDELYAAVKADPATRHLPVVIASMSDPEHADRFGLLKSADFANTHCYADGGPPGFRWDWYMAKARLNCEKPVIATESGYHNSLAPNPARKHWIPGIYQRAAGKYIPRMVLDYQLRGIVRTYYYELIDLFPNSQVADHNFGLLHNDGTPKPAFTALKNLIALLKDTGPEFTPGQLDYERSGDTGAVRTLLLQKRDGRFYLVLWQNGRSYDTKAQTDLDVPPIDLVLRLTKAAKRISTFQPCVDAAPESQAAAAAEIRLKVQDHPLVVEIMP